MNTNNGANDPLRWNYEVGRVRQQEQQGVSPFFIYFFHFLLLTFVFYHDSSRTRVTTNEQDPSGTPSGCGNGPNLRYVPPLSFFSCSYGLPRTLCYSTNTHEHRGATRVRAAPP